MILEKFLNIALANLKDKLLFLYPLILFKAW